MTEEAQIRSVALFFFFALQSEALAKVATFRAVRIARKKGRREKLADSEIPPRLILITHRVWRKVSKLKSLKPDPSAEGRYEAGFLIPEVLDIGPWRQFQKEGETDELLAVIWSRVLGFADVDIARGLGTSVGTVRHRVGRGLRHLGSLQKLRGSYG